MVDMANNLGPEMSALLNVLWQPAFRSDLKNFLS